MNLLVFLIACHGVTNIVTSGKLFESLRKSIESRSKMAGYWIKCPMCLGFFVGVAWRLGGIGVDGGLNMPLNLFLNGLLASAGCWAARVVLHRLGEDEL